MHIVIYFWCPSVIFTKKSSWTFSSREPIAFITSINKVIRRTESNSWMITDIRVEAAYRVFFFTRIFGQFSNRSTTTIKFNWTFWFYVCVKSNVIFSLKNAFFCCNEQSLFSLKISLFLYTKSNFVLRLHIWSFHCWSSVQINVRDIVPSGNS